MLLVTHDRWFLDEVCESMWEVHDGTIDPFEGGYSAYMLQRVERDRQADVREARRRNLARKELAWLSRGARARSTKQKFHVKQARELIADVPPLRNTLELKQMATSRLGKQVVDLIDVTQVFAAENGVTVDGTPPSRCRAAGVHGRRRHCRCRRDRPGCGRDGGLRVPRGRGASNVCGAAGVRRRRVGS